MTSVLRVIADGLIHRAEELPRESRAAHHLRDAAANLLDADCALDPEVRTTQPRGRADER